MQLNNKTETEPTDRTLEKFWLVWFGVFLCWLFNAKVIFQEEQKRFYWTHVWDIRGFIPFPGVFVRKWT